MSANGIRTALPVILGVLAWAPSFASQRFAHPLPRDQTGVVLTLPAKYPRRWAFLDYASERIEIRDVGDDSRRVLGEVQARDSTTMLIPKDRPEFYTADTVWSRYTRGTRTDYITVYDKRTLEPIGEIVLPGAKRALITAQQGMFEFTDHERLGLVFNFTPAASVTVVDLVHRKVLGDVDIPGCALIFPSGRIGFSTLCASGTVFSVKLDAAGQVVGHSESKPFNHLGHNPLFTASTMIDGVRYFVTMRGDAQPIDMRHADARVLPSWPLVTPAERAAHWRPSGWQLVASDAHGELYVLMQAHAHEGTQKDAADEVWVYDAATKQRLRRLRLVRPGSSIALTHGAHPTLLVQADQRLDVYDPETGALIRSMDLPGLHTRLLIEPVR